MTDAVPASAAVVVIGGGWAGCAAAVALANAGFRVTLVESAPVLGGRARRVVREGRSLDNGQHLMLGAYRETLDLIAMLHDSLPYVRAPLAIAPFDAHQRNAVALRARALPAPLGLAWALVRARGLTLRERLATLRWFARLQRRGFRCGADESVATLTSALPVAAAEKFLHPLCLAALNTPPAQASAQVFANVLQAAFASDASASDLIVATGDLGALLPDAAQRWLERRGHAVLRGSSATVVGVDAGRIDVDVRGRTGTYDAALVAVGPHQLARVFAPPPARLPAIDAACRAAAALRYEPITTVYLGYATPIDLGAALVRLDDAPGQWVFARPDIARSGGDASIAGVVAVAISAHGPHDALAHDALAHATDAQLRRLRTGWPPLAWSWVVEEKRATYACMPAQRRPRAGLLAPRLALAGDYTDAMFPATLEAAVRSGRDAAAALAVSLSPR